MKKYKYYSKYTNTWVFTDSLATAMNNSYYVQKPYYKLNTGKYIMQDIPHTLNLSNTDTFHAHETKGRRAKSDQISRVQRVTIGKKQEA